MKKNKKIKENNPQSIGDWLADEGYYPSMQDEIVTLIQKDHGVFIQLIDSISDESKRLIQSIIDSKEL